MATRLPEDRPWPECRGTDCGSGRFDHDRQVIEVGEKSGQCLKRRRGILIDGEPAHPSQDSARRLTTGSKVGADTVTISGRFASSERSCNPYPARTWFGASNAT